LQKSVTIGDAAFTIEVVRHDPVWHAEAHRADGRRFGPTIVDADAARGAERLERWLAWQCEHDEKLRALQEAEEAYHRTIAGSAFASAAEGPSATELQADALRRLEHARLALDAARRQRPE
jgi:hypothetical protein